MSVNDGIELIVINYLCRQPTLQGFWARNLIL
ncbi:hypothetical protein HMPREF1223_13982 [Pseudomonas aeruginosa str. Stone 130]|nr:hypothetical protein HMPREF1223_13982 [Pseudomonas aeruginosa str. Stone 130]